MDKFYFMKNGQAESFSTVGKDKSRFKGCPSKNFNIDKCWDSVIFPFFPEFDYVTEFFYVFPKILVK